MDISMAYFLADIVPLDQTDSLLRLMSLFALTDTARCTRQHVSVRTLALITASAGDAVAPVTYTGGGRECDFCPKKMHSASEQRTFNIVQINFVL